MSRKRSSRIAIKESVQEEEARLAQEQSELIARASRASRHKVSLNPDPEANSDAGGSGTPSGVAHESREDRLKKREEEKLAREKLAEEKALEEVRKLEREEMIRANGGKVPKGMETPEELKAIEEEERKVEAAERKRVRDEVEKEKRRIRREKNKAAKLVAGSGATVGGKVEEQKNGNEEEVWFLSCDVCRKGGFMVRFSF